VGFFHRRPYIFFILPAFVVYAVFSVYPVLSTIPYSLTSWSGVGAARFVGLENFRTIFGSPDLVPQVLGAFTNTFLLLSLTYAVLNPIVIAVAYLLFKKIRGSEVFKTVIFMPQFMNVVAVTFIVTLFFSPGIGLYGNVMTALGLGAWATPGIWAKPSQGIPLVLLVGGWRGIGYELLLYIAAFNMVPAELDEAAVMDGAGGAQRFFKVYFPMIAPTFTNVVVLMYIWTLTTFDIPYLLGGVNGGVNGCMDTIQLFFYRTVFARGGYSSNFMGIGSTIALVILAVLLGGSLLLQTFLGRREHNVSH
jgi:raffinose/stachyose/melibiose transport system permease protein